MTNKRLTDFPTNSSPADDDWVYCVDVSDTTDSPLGSSKKVRLGDTPGLAGAIAGVASANAEIVNLKQRVFSVKDYGAIGNGIAADTSAFVETILAITTAGGGVMYIPDGTYITAPFGLASNITILGHGAKSILKSNSTTTNPVIYHIGSVGSQIDNVVIKDIAVDGHWLANQSEAGSNGLITATYVNNITIENCHLSHSRFMGININNCTKVKVLNNAIKNCVRDMIGVWSSPNTIIIGNILTGNDDDGISFHSMGEVPVRNNIIISNNELTDTGPIRAISMLGITITGNRINRPKGQGIAALNSNPGFTGLLASSSFNNISNNVITDVIDRQYFINGASSNDNLRTYILFDTIKAQAGALASIPGMPDGTGVVNDPYGYYYTNSGATGNDAVRYGSTNKITGNVLKRTLPAVANYSLWGFGLAFTKNGFINLPLTNSHLDGQGVAFRLPTESLLITDNIVDCGNYGIIAQLASGVTVSDRLAKSVVITNNIIRNTKLAGINLSLGSFSHQDIKLENNVIDCDPLFISANRGANGTWLASGNPIAINGDNCGSLVVAKNTFRNACQVFSQAGASAFQVIENNLLFANPLVSGFSVTNAGIGTIPGIGNGGQFWLQYENCDPASAQLGNSLGHNFRNASSIPAAGTWFANSWVANRVMSVSGTAGSRYIVLGWARLTTGANHVLNTDWIETRVLTGT